MIRRKKEVWLDTRSGTPGSHAATVMLQNEPLFILPAMVSFLTSRRKTLGREQHGQQIVMVSNSDAASFVSRRFCNQRLDPQEFSVTKDAQLLCWEFGSFSEGLTVESWMRKQDAKEKWKVWS